MFSSHPILGSFFLWDCIIIIVRPKCFIQCHDLGTVAFDVLAGVTLMVDVDYVGGF